ncbi:MAG: hypothetical protein V3U92_05605 [Cellulophaga sp.]
METSASPSNKQKVAKPSPFKLACSSNRESSFLPIIFTENDPNGVFLKSFP